MSRSPTSGDDKEDVAESAQADLKTRQSPASGGEERPDGAAQDATDVAADAGGDPAQQRASGDKTSVGNAESPRKSRESARKGGSGEAGDGGDAAEGGANADQRARDRRGAGAGAGSGGGDRSRPRGRAAGRPTGALVSDKPGERQRGRRMFGSLLGHLGAAKKALAEPSAALARRQEAAAKAEAAAAALRSGEAAREARLEDARKAHEAAVRRMGERWVANAEQIAANPALMTDTSPRLFWTPATETAESKALRAKQQEERDAAVKKAQEEAAAALATAVEDNKRDCEKQQAAAARRGKAGPGTPRGGGKSPRAQKRRGRGHSFGEGGKNGTRGAGRDTRGRGARTDNDNDGGGRARESKRARLGKSASRSPSPKRDRRRRRRP